MGVIAEGILRGCQSLFTPVSLGYPISVFNKNSTLKARICDGDGAIVYGHPGLCASGARQFSSRLWGWHCYRVACARSVVNERAQAECQKGGTQD